MKKRSLKILFIILLIAVSYGFIIFKIISFDELRNLSMQNIRFTGHYFFLITAILLVPINWGTEAIKWKMLVKKTQEITFFYSLKAVFSGIMLGIFTPNRVGEIGGRILYLDKGNRTYGLLATGLGSIAQFIATIINGFIGLALLLLLYPEPNQFSTFLNLVSILLVIVLFLLILWFYFNSGIIQPALLKIPFFSKRENQIIFFSESSRIVLLKVLLLSNFRYLTFILQFYLLLSFFDVQISIAQAYFSISLVYLFSTIIPTTTLVELGVKGSLAIFFIGLFSDNYVGIILSTIILWIINLALPAIIGSIFFIKKGFQ